MFMCGKCLQKHYHFLYIAFSVMEIFQFRKLLCKYLYICNPPPPNFMIISSSQFSPWPVFK